MPRRGERRENVVVRMSGAVRSAVDERAAIENVKRSDYVRHAVEFALEAMPPGWRPTTEATARPLDSADLHERS